MDQSPHRDYSDFIAAVKQLTPTKDAFLALVRKLNTVINTLDELQTYAMAYNNEYRANGRYHYELGEDDKQVLVDDTTDVLEQSAHEVVVKQANTLRSVQSLAEQLSDSPLTLKEMSQNLTVSRLSGTSNSGFTARFAHTIVVAADAVNDNSLVPSGRIISPDYDAGVDGTRRQLAGGCKELAVNPTLGPLWGGQAAMIIPGTGQTSLWYLWGTGSTQQNAPDDSYYLVWKNPVSNEYFAITNVKCYVNYNHADKFIEDPAQTNRLEVIFWTNFTSAPMTLEPIGGQLFNVLPGRLNLQLGTARMDIDTKKYLTDYFVEYDPVSTQPISTVDTLQKDTGISAPVIKTLLDSVGIDFADLADLLPTD